MLTVEIRQDNAAFGDGALREETARILRSIAGRIEAGHDSGRCMDVHGNSVGTWAMEEAED